MNSSDPIERLKNLEDPPAPFSEGARLPWEDEAFSRQFSRLSGGSEEMREIQARFFMAHLKPAPGVQVLEIGCGDGGLCLKLAEAGLRPTGLDAGPYPLEKARALTAGGKFEVVESDYRRHAADGAYDWIVFLSGNFCDMKEIEAADFLSLCRKNLSPGGGLFFEIPAAAFGACYDGRQEWRFEDDSIAGTGRQLILGDFTLNSKLQYVYSQHCLLLDTGEIRSFCQSQQLYELKRLEGLLNAAGFRLNQTWSGWNGEPFDEEESFWLLFHAQCP